MLRFVDSFRAHHPTVLHLSADWVEEERGVLAWEAAGVSRGSSSVPPTPESTPVLVFHVAQSPVVSAGGAGGDRVRASPGPDPVPPCDTSLIRLSAAQLTWALLVAGSSVESVVLSVHEPGGGSPLPQHQLLTALGQHLLTYAGIGCVVCWPPGFPDPPTPGGSAIPSPNTFIAHWLRSTPPPSRGSFSRALLATAPDAIASLFGGAPAGSILPVVLGDGPTAEPAPRFSASKGEIPFSALGNAGGRELGHGTFGAVYLRSWNDMEVAVKLIRSDADGPLPEREKQALLSDIRGLMRVEHRNVVRVWGYCTEPLALVMEYYPLGGLHTWLSRNPMPSSSSSSSSERRAAMAVRCELFLQAAVAIKVLHSRRIAHLDLKANNVLVKEEHGKLVAVVTDLGLASLGSTPPTHEAAGGAGGAPPTHAEPSHLLPAFREDVMFWAVMVADAGFGALGEWSPTPVPSDEPDRWKWMRRQWRANVNRPSVRSELLPEGLPQLLQRCWDVSPSSRPPMEEVVEELKRVRQALGT